MSPRKRSGRYRFHGLGVAPSPRPLSEIQDAQISNLRSGCAQQHCKRGAEHGPCLISTNHRKLLDKRCYCLIVFKKLEQQLDRNRRSQKNRSAAHLLRAAFHHVCKLHHLENPLSPQKRPRRRVLLRTQPGAPTRPLKLGFSNSDFG